MAKDNVEKWQKHFEKSGEGMQEHDLVNTLRDTKREIRSEWFQFKQALNYLHGIELEDRTLNMLLVYLLRRGVL